MALEVTGMRGRDPFQKPDFGDNSQRPAWLQEQVQRRLESVDPKASALFGCCRVVSVGEQTVIAMVPRGLSRKVPRYLTKWENTAREALGRWVVLVVRTERKGGPT